MRFLYLLILALFISAAPAQDSTSGIQFEFQTGLVKFSMDGLFDNGDFAWGVVYQTPRAIFEPGLFITSNVDIVSGDREEVHLGTLLSLQIMRSLSVGVYYDFWKSGIGLDGWRKDNAGFTFAYNFNL